MSELAAGYHHDLLLTSFPILTGHLYEDEFDVDLNEAFSYLEADMDISISVEFDTLSSFREDSTYFVDHIESLRIETEGDVFM